MTGELFEHYCADKLLRMGFRSAKVTPRLGRYGLMLFPTRRDKPGGSMIAEMNTQWNKEEAKVKKPTAIVAWEEWFFY